MIRRKIDLKLTFPCCQGCDIPLHKRKCVIADSLLTASDEEFAKLGLKPESGMEDDDGNPLCETCAKNYKKPCFICKLLIAKNQIQDSYGWPTEVIFKGCYASVPAKDYEQAQKACQRIHQYDFE